MRQERRSSASKPALILSFRRVLQYGLPGVDAWPNESIGLPQRHPLSNYPMHQPDSSFPPYSATIQPIGGFIQIWPTSALPLPPPSPPFFSLPFPRHFSITDLWSFLLWLRPRQPGLCRVALHF